MASLNGKEILIVDDAEDGRKLAAKVLENDGAVVNQADTVETGLEIARRSRPHLVLLDLNFGGLTGFDFLAKRREDPAFAGIPVIVLSAVNDREGVTRAVTLGANDYLVKPFRATQLLQKARKQLMVSSFLELRFTPADSLPVQVTVKGQVIHYSEFGFRIESSVKFKSDETVNVSSELLDTLPLQEVILKTSNVKSVYVGPNRYANSVLFTGVGESFVKKVKRILGEA